MTRRLARVVCVACVLAGYGIACVGLPLPKLIRKDLSAPFPCADRGCGCMSAEECWAGCCCFTREQRLAWAVEHGVEIPAWVLNESQKPCCKARQVASCCQHRKAERSCCSKTARPKPPEKTEWVIGMMARKCRGQGCDWLAAGAVLAGPPHVTWRESLPCLGEVALRKRLHLPILASPPVPPPRIARVG